MGIKSNKLADGVGFEPTMTLPPCRFSRPVPSTTRPPIQTTFLIAYYFIVYDYLWADYRSNQSSLTKKHLEKMVRLLSTVLYDVVNWCRDTL